MRSVVNVGQSHVARFLARWRLSGAVNVLAILLAGGMAPVSPAVFAQERPGHESLAHESLAHESPARDFHIPTQSLPTALREFARQSGLQLAYAEDMVAGLSSTTVQGNFQTRQALTRLLSGTGLQFVFTGNSTVVLSRAGSAALDGSDAVLSPVRVGGVAWEREAVYHTPGSVSVITREDMDRMTIRNTADVFSGTAGVFTSQLRTDPGVSVNIRGMQDFGRVNVMLDGVRQNFQKSGHGSNGQAYIDPALLAGVDVAKGPQSTVGGAGAIGGVVNFRTIGVQDLLRPDQRHGGRINLTAGDNAYRFAGDAAVASRFSDQFDAVAAISRKRIGDYDTGQRGFSSIYNQPGFTMKNTLHEQWAGLLKLGWQPDEAQRIGLSYIGLDADFGEMQYNSTNDNFYQVRSDTVKLDYQLYPADSDWINLNASLYHTMTRRTEGRRFYRNEHRDLNRDLRYQTSTVGGTLSNLVLREWGDWQAEWNSGGEFFYDWTDPRAQSSQEAELNQDFDAGWFTGSTPEGERLVGSLFSELALDRHDWLHLSAGLRYDWYRLQGDGEFFVGTIRNPPGVRPPTTRIYTRFETDRHDGLVSPRVMAAVKPWESVQLFTSYAGGMRPPAITETLFSGGHVNNMWANYPGVNLKPERAWSWEIGANLLYNDVLVQNDSLRLKMAWFDTRVENYIINAKVMGPTSTTDGGLFAPMAFVNLLNDVRFTGYEAQLDYDAGRVFAQLAYTDVKADLGDKRYNPFPLGSWVGYPPTSLGTGDNAYADIFYSGPPKRKLATSIGVRAFERTVEFGTRFRFEQPQEESVAPNIILRVFDLWASWQPVPALTLRLSVDNVRDQYYFELLGNGTAMTAPGRTVTGTVSWAF